MKKSLFIAFFLCFFISSYGEYESPPYVYYVREIIQSFVPQIKKEFDLYCCGENLGMPYNVEGIGLSFNCYKRATIEEARVLSILVTEKLIEAINSHEEIRPYLSEYPFPARRVNTSISFKDSEGHLYADGSISTVFHIGSSIEYCNRDSFKVCYVDLLEEPYEEAAKIVKTAGIKKPLEHQTTELEAAIDKVFKDFQKAMRSRYKCKCFSIGCKKDKFLEEVSGVFTVFKRTTHEQAREVQVYATETLLDIINNNKKLMPYLNEYPFTADQLKLRLEFRQNKYWGENSSFTDGAMDSSVLENGQVTYELDEILNPDDWENRVRHFVTVGVEPYEKALRIVGKPKPSKFAFWRKVLFPFTFLH